MPCMLNFTPSALSGLLETDTQSKCILLAALLTAILPLEIHHLVAGFLGAVGYMFMQWLEPTVKRSGRPQAQPAKLQREPVKVRREAPRVASGFTLEEDQKWSQLRLPAIEVKKPSVKPVPSPCFKAITLEDELRELLQGLKATAESRRQVAAIASALRRALAVEPRVVCLARPTQGTAFGVAVPEVEAVLLVDGQDLKLQKSMIRSCTDRLVLQGAFKFRRSTFRGAEPKVTLISPEGVAFNLSVNAQTPQRSEELFKAAVWLNPLAEELILVIRRWAKDRGISHAAKGHLSPYAWMLLAVYYLQAMRQLPAMHHVVSRAEVPDFKPPKTSCGALLRGFMKFYDSLDWAKECIAVRQGHRVTLRRAVTLVSDGQSQPGPCIEDPFEATSNLASHMHWLSMERLREELHRGARLGSLAELLEPWSPPDMD